MNIGGTQAMHGLLKACGYSDSDILAFGGINGVTIEANHEQQLKVEVRTVGGTSDNRARDLIKDIIEDINRSFNEKREVEDSSNEKNKPVPVIPEVGKTYNVYSGQNYIISIKCDGLKVNSIVHEGKRKEMLRCYFGELTHVFFDKACEGGYDFYETTETKL